MGLIGCNSAEKRDVENLNNGFYGAFVRCNGGILRDLAMKIQLNVYNIVSFYS